MFYIAVAHSAFNVINTIVFLPFVGWLEKVSVWAVPKKAGAVEVGTKYLEKHLLVNQITYLVKGLRYSFGAFFSRQIVMHRS